MGETGINWGLATEMAILSSVSYGEGELFSEWYDHVERFEHRKSDTEAYALAGHGMIILVVRGSDSFKDWWYNIRKFGVDETGAYKGFREAVDGLLEAGILGFVGKHDGQLHLTGHSKGGGIVQVMAAGICGVDGVWCFGSPMVGGRKWAKSYPLRETTHSFSLTIDPITFLPPWAFGFRRATPLIRIGGGFSHSHIEYTEMLERIRKERGV